MQLQIFRSWSANRNKVRILQVHGVVPVHHIQGQILVKFIEQVIMQKIAEVRLQVVERMLETTKELPQIRGVPVPQIQEQMMEFVEIPEKRVHVLERIQEQTGDHTSVSECAMSR